MLNLNEMSKEIYQVSVEHGWYEDEENRDANTKIALIHSEWSEALEEYRANRPMVWFECGLDKKPCEEEQCSDWSGGRCRERGMKPEGIAIELIDGCIRILDFVGYKGWPIPEVWDTVEKLMECAKQIQYNAFEIRAENTSLPVLVRFLHWYTAEFEMNEELSDSMLSLLEAVGVAFLWIKTHGGDPEDLLRMKHEYNKTRPYKHGGKRC